jgi:hypothetical protein
MLIVDAGVAGELVAGLTHHPADGAVRHGIFGQGDVTFGHVAIEGAVHGEQRPGREVIQPELLAVFETQTIELRSLVVPQGVEVAPSQGATAGRQERAGSGHGGSGLGVRIGLLLDAH